MLKKLTLISMILALLASPVVLADDDFTATGDVLVTGGAVTSVKSDLIVVSGCGDDDQKCSCTHSGATLTMKGTGTSGTGTGLDFTCNWEVYTSNGSCLIQWRIDIPYSGHNGTNVVVTDGCKIMSGFDPKIGCSGHDFPSLAAAVQMTGTQSGGAWSNIPKGDCS